MSGPDPRRALPGVDRLLESARDRGWTEQWGRETVTEALRRALAEERERIAGPTAPADDVERRVLERAECLLEGWQRPSLRRVLNGTGVALHTNLGRAPLAEEAVEAVAEVSAGYSNLEYDLGRGERGSRYDHCTELLDRLTGAEASLVVNNNAAAVALAVHALAAGREVVASRGELVEIGGSFRMPDVVEAAGGRLVEVGTTNRTRVSDYRGAMGPETGLLLKVHPSNYRVEGFTESVGLEELVELGREGGVPVVHDLGSGLLRPRAVPDLLPEPTPGDSLEVGADLVTWSGDKLLGGPQAGILNGRGEVVDRLRGDPMLRTFRVDKMTLAALDATLRAYLGAGDDPPVPALRILSEPAEEVERRARSALEALSPRPPARVEVERTTAVVGGGAYPRERLPSAGLRVAGLSAERVARACRGGSPPLVGRIVEGEFYVDFRTILPGEEPAVARALGAALERTASDAEREG